MALSKTEVNDKFKNAKIGFGSWRKTYVVFMYVISIQFLNEFKH